MNHIDGIVENVYLGRPGDTSQRIAWSDVHHPYSRSPVEQECIYESSTLSPIKILEKLEQWRIEFKMFHLYVWALNTCQSHICIFNLRGFTSAQKKFHRQNGRTQFAGEFLSLRYGNWNGEYMKWKKKSRTSDQRFGERSRSGGRFIDIHPLLGEHSSSRGHRAHAWEFRYSRSVVIYPLDRFHAKQSLVPRFTKDGHEVTENQISCRHVDGLQKLIIPRSR